MDTIRWIVIFQFTSIGPLALNIVNQNGLHQADIPRVQVAMMVANLDQEMARKEEEHRKHESKNDI